MTAEPSREPTLADVLAEIRVLHLEIRTAAAEQRAALSEFRLAATEALARLHERVDTVIDSIADFRREYAEHTHSED